MRMISKRYFMMFIGVALSIMAIVFPLFIEKKGIFSTLEPSDWLNFWAQYIGTWIALIGTSIVTVLLTSRQIQANQRMTLTMYQVPDRIKYISEIVDLVSDFEFHAQAPVFVYQDTTFLRQQDWYTFVEQIDDFREYSGTMGERLSRYRFKLPKIFAPELKNIIGQDSEVQKIMNNIFNNAEIAEMYIDRYPDAPDEHKDIIRENIESLIVETNREIKQLRKILIDFCNAGVKCKIIIEDNVE